MKILLQKQKSAFSLIETVIAVAIIAMVLLFSVTLGSVSLRNMVNKAQTAQATAIARSNLEKVRNIRDNTWQNSDYANCNQAGDNNNSWDCWVNSDHSIRVAASDFGNEYLLKSSSGGNYLEAANGQKNSDLLVFGNNSQVVYQSLIRVRKVSTFSGDFSISMDNYLSQDSAADITTLNSKIYLVESEVSWDIFGRSQKVVLRTYLSDWLPRF